MTEEPISLNKGYELPPRTLVLCHTHVAGRQEENFTNGNQFYPGMYILGQKSCPIHYFTS